jgi:hypothetical protein
MVKTCFAGRIARNAIAFIDCFDGPLRAFLVAAGLVKNETVLALLTGYCILATSTALNTLKARSLSDVKTHSAVVNTT